MEDRKNFSAGYKPAVAITRLTISAYLSSLMRDFYNPRFHVLAHAVLEFTQELVLTICVRTDSYGNSFDAAELSRFFAKIPRRSPFGTTAQYHG